MEDTTFAQEANLPHSDAMPPRLMHMCATTPLHNKEPQSSADDCYTTMAPPHTQWPASMLESTAVTTDWREFAFAKMKWLQPAAPVSMTDAVRQHSNQVLASKGGTALECLAASCCCWHHKVQLRVEALANISMRVQHVRLPPVSTPCFSLGYSHS